MTAAVGTPGERVATRMVPLSLLIASLVVVASGLGLLASSTYQHETGNWRMQAQGQDVGNLLAAAVLIVTSVRARASLRSFLLWIGTMFYFLYAYVVYAFAVHFGRLFLVYVAVLGLVFYGLLGARTLAARWEKPAYPAGGSRRLAAAVLAGTGLLFGLLWLGEVIPATITGVSPASLTEAGLAVNPIHAIDLSVVLPGMLATAYLTSKGNPVGNFLVAPWLMFSALMGLSIVAAMGIIVGSGDSSALPPMFMVATIVAVSLFALSRYVRQVEARPRT